MSKLKILPGFYFILAAYFLILPLRWCVAWIAASIFHELCHIAALKLCRCRLYCVTVSASGAQIESDCQSEVQKLICTAAGPVGGATLLLVSGIFPRTAICAMIQSVYNLLPFTCLDGGRALACTVNLFCKNRKSEKILEAIQRFFMASLIFLALYGSVYLHLGLMPCILVAVLLVKNKKSLAKNSLSEYNK